MKLSKKASPGTYVKFDTPDVNVTYKFNIEFAALNIFGYYKNIFGINEFEDKNTAFVGLRAYELNKDKKLIEVTGDPNIASEVTYRIKKEGNKQYKYCKFISHLNPNDTSYSKAEINEKDEVTEIKCSVQRLGDLTITHHSPEDPDDNGSKIWLIVLGSILGVLVLAGLIYVLIRCCKKKENSDELKSEVYSKKTDPLV